MELYDGRPDNTDGRQDNEIRVYDLLDSTSWIMSRGCVDDILNFLSTTSKYSAIRIVFEDKSLEDCDEKTS